MTKDEEKKAKDELEAYALEKFGVDLDKRKSLESLQEKVAEMEKANGTEPLPKLNGKRENLAKEVEDPMPRNFATVDTGADEDRLQWLQKRAVAIWQGQSSSLPIGERIGRIRAAMKDRGYSQSEIEQIELPTNQDYKRFL